MGLTFVSSLRFVEWSVHRSLVCWSYFDIFTDGAAFQSINTLPFWERALGNCSVNSTDRRNLTKYKAHRVLAILVHVSSCNPWAVWLMIQLPTSPFSDLWLSQSVISTGQILKSCWCWICLLIVPIMIAQIHSHYSIMTGLSLKMTVLLWSSWKSLKSITHRS